MDIDRSLFGDGPYPSTGPLAVLARVAFVGAVAAILVAVFLPPHMVPNFVRSPYLQHFAAFYVAGLAALAAFPRMRLRALAIGMFVFATALEGSRLVVGGYLPHLVDNWVADLGGLATAFAPIIVERFRRRFPRAPR